MTSFWGAAWRMQQQRQRRGTILEPPWITLALYVTHMARIDRSKHINSHSIADDDTDSHPDWRSLGCCLPQASIVASKAGLRKQMNDCQNVSSGLN